MKSVLLPQVKDLEQQKLAFVSVFLVSSQTEKKKIEKTKKKNRLAMFEFLIRFLCCSPPSQAIICCKKQQFS